MKVLWLASWYPSELKPLDGDFIQRHAKAASYFNDIYLIHVVKDPLGTITKTYTIKSTKDGRLTENVIYYYSPFKNLPGKLISEWKYRNLFKKHINKLFERHGKPDIVHLHVGMKAGIIAQWIYDKYKIPYLLTEHWTGFLPEAVPSFKNLSAYYQYRYKDIIKKAASVSVVSKYLEKYIKIIAPHINTIVIPNVIDTSIFKPGALNVSSKINFLHISNLSFQKNPEKIIDAIKILITDGWDVQLDIIGPKDNALIQKSDTLGLKNNIHFHHETSQIELLPYLNRADALILYSRYETFGCVIIEANACGVPVIASDIPVLHEIVTEGFNGIFAHPNEVISLSKTLKKFISTKHDFNKEDISNHAHKLYNYSRIGKQFDNWYKVHLDALYKIS